VTRLVSRIRTTFQVSLPVSAVFENPELCSLSKAVMSHLTDHPLQDDTRALEAELSSLSETELRAILAEDLANE
jgi:hypothetical protein